MPEMTYAQALNAALREEMQRDENVVLMGEDVAGQGGVFTVSKGLLDEFGADRVRDTPISEAGFISLAAGAAMTGMRPVVEIMYVDFMLVAADSIINQVAKLRYMSGGQVTVPLVIRTQQGGGKGNAAQHSQSLDALFAHVPGLKVVLPATPADAKGMLKAAIRDENPVIFIEHKLLYFVKGEVPDEVEPIPLDKAAVKREGTDVTIVGLSRSVQMALDAADKLAERGISAEVIDLRSVRPLDLDTIMESVAKTHRLVLVHEAVQYGSVMSEIAATVQEQGFDLLDGPIQRVGGADSPVAYSLPLERTQLPDVEKIILAVERVV